METKKRKPRAKTVRRKDWLVHGLEALRVYGLRGLGAEPLAKLIGVTKGSFYNQFKDRQDLLNSILELWEKEVTGKVINRIARVPGGPKKRLLAMLEYVLQDKFDKYDPAMRAWASHDETAAEVVRRVDKERLSFMKSLFEEAGFSKREAEMRARVMYYYMIGEFSIMTDDLDNKRLNLLRSTSKFLTS